MRVSRSRVTLISSIGLAVIWFALWLYTSPDFRTVTLPVSAWINAPTEAELFISYTPNSPARRLIPKDSENNRTGTWLVELPPSREYNLSLEVRKSSTAVHFGGFQVVRISPEYQNIEFVLSDTSLWELGSHQISNGQVSLQSGDQISLAPTVFSADPKVGRWIPAGITLGAWLILIGMLVPLLAGKELSHAHCRCSQALKVGDTWFLVTAVLYIGFVASTLTEVWPNDSISYLQKAVALGENWEFVTEDILFRLNRLPGYPLLLALIFKLTGYNLSLISLYQGLLLLTATFWLQRELRIIGGLALAVPATLLVLFAPPALWSINLVATEGLFLIVGVCVTAASLRYYRLQRKRDLLLLTLFIVCSQTIRMNGVMWLAFPGLVGLHYVLHNYTSLFHSKQRTSFLAGVGIRLIPAIAVFVFLLLWSLRNERVMDYAAPTDLNSITKANQVFFTGLYDPHALSNSEEITQVTRDRFTQGFFYHGWHLRSQFLKKPEVSGENWSMFNKGVLHRLDEELYSFAKANNDLIEPQIKMASIVRLLFYGLWLPHERSFVQITVGDDYPLKDKLRNAKTVEKQLNKIGLASNGTVMATIDHGFIQKAYNALTPLYKYLRWILIVGFLLGLLVRPSSRPWLVVIFAAPYFANILLNAYVGYIQSRYIAPFDFLLILAALAVWLSNDSPIDKQLNSNSQLAAGE